MNIFYVRLNKTTFNNRDALVDACVTVYPVDIDQCSTNILGDDYISYCTTVGRTFGVV